MEILRLKQAPQCVGGDHVQRLSYTSSVFAEWENLMSDGFNKAFQDFYSACEDAARDPAKTPTVAECGKAECVFHIERLASKRKLLKKQIRACETAFRELGSWTRPQASLPEDEVQLGDAAAKAAVPVAKAEESGDTDPKAGAQQAREAVEPGAAEKADEPRDADPSVPEPAAVEKARERG